MTVQLSHHVQKRIVKAALDSGRKQKGPEVIGCWAKNIMQLYNLWCGFTAAVIKHMCY